MEKSIIYYIPNCVVCDECHYFLTESNYNTDTSFSFRWIRECFADKVRVFMSATIKDIRQYIKAYDFKWEILGGRDKYYLPNLESVEQYEKSRKYNMRWNLTKFYDYDIERKYDYLNVRIMYDIPNGSGKADGIVKMIEEQDILKVNDAIVEKWLIFVDNINMGEQLEKKLETDKAVFISSRNRREEDKAEVIDDISINEKTKKRFIIATSVLDNGINLKDIELRNVILGADTETEFIQMLGRKRRDQKNLNVYIYPRNRQYFENRLSVTLRKVKIANEYLRCLAECRNEDTYDYKEDMAIERLDIKMMRKIADNNISIEDVRSLFNVYGGILYLNLLAYQNIKNLNEYYEKVIKEFDEYGEDAFVKIQLGWLGIEGKKADGIIADSKRSNLDVCREKVIERIKCVLNKPLSDEENIKLKLDIKKELVFLVKATENKLTEDEKKISLFRSGAE